MKTLAYTSDEELFESFRNGNIDAFEQIYARYWDCLTREAYRQMGAFVEIKDIVQDVFITLIQKASGININVSLKAYLYQMLHYRIINNKRDRRIHVCCYDEISWMNKNRSVYSDDYETKELNAYMNRVIFSLPEKCKEVYLLSRKKNYSYKDISRELNISVSTVEKHIIKALKIIKCKLQYRYELN